jgi:hypothetical protein
MAGQSFRICKGQPYALCAAARCTVYDGVVCCQCEKKSGDSISLAFQTSKSADVCSVVAAGIKSRYLVRSRLSRSTEIVRCTTARAATRPAPTPNRDGGLCFASTEGAKFTGFDQPVPKGQIICSCPVSSAGANQGGYQIMGPYPCQKSCFQYCHPSVANKKTGATMYVRAPTGTAQALAVQLNGSVPALNECPGQR